MQQPRALGDRLRWLEGGGPIWSKEATAAVTGYKSLALGGWAHHVLATRVAAGVSSGAAADEYDLGGTTGTPVSLLPGVTYGSRRTFGVRGFPSGIETGTTVAVTSAEYRAPLFAPHRGPGLWPVFLDRTSLNVFADAGSASGGFPGGGSFASHWIGSVGAELSANVGVQYDVPYILRLGLAAPVVNHSGQHVSDVSAYVSLGVSF